MDKKYNYLYLIESTFNGKYYIGIHSTDNLDDGYMGSGKRLNQDIERFGIDSYDKRILEFCNSREELIKKEEEIVTSDIIDNWHCLNMVEGGSEKKKKYYVKGFNQSEWDKVKFIDMIKDGEIISVINYLVPYHLKLGWINCTKKQINEHREKMSRFKDDEVYCAIRKLSEDDEGDKSDWDNTIIRFKHLNWYLKRGWEIEIEPEEFKIYIKRQKIKSKIINGCSDGNYKKLLENIEELIDKEIEKMDSLGAIQN